MVYPSDKSESPVSEVSELSTKFGISTLGFPDLPVIYFLNFAASLLLGALETLSSSL